MHVASFKRPPIVTAFVLGMYKNMAASFSMGHCELVEGELVAAAAHARAQPAMAHSTARTSPMYVCMYCCAIFARTCLNASRLLFTSKFAGQSPQTEAIGQQAAMTPLAVMPPELFHILARFVPLAAIFVIRTCRSSWTRFAKDPFVWAEAFKLMLGARMSRARMIRRISGIVKTCPTLTRVIPVPLALGTYFDVSPNGKLVACGNDDVDDFEVRVHVVETHRNVATLRLGKREFGCLFSP